MVPGSELVFGTNNSTLPTLKSTFHVVPSSKMIVFVDPVQGRRKFDG